MTISPNHIDTLVDKLFEGHDANVYAVLDGASILNLVQILEQSQAEFECLYRGELDPELQQVAPYLVALPKNSALAHWVLDGIGHHWGIFAVSTADMRGMRKHFRTFLMIYDSCNQPVYFRYYDPRILRAFLSVCNAALGLPEGTIKDADLRNDKTGCRAALYRNESNGKLIRVPRDTQPDSLVDWKTNIDNGQGKDTKQYSAMRDLSGKLAKNNISFDLSGYSKGGGLAQEGALKSPKSKVVVFNSAGLNDASLARTGNSSFDSLISRTQAYCAEGDFLTFMNQTTNPDKQITNAELERAIEKDDAAAVSAAIRNGTDVNARGVHGVTLVE